MKSFWSRLVSWVRGTQEAKPAPPEPEPHAAAPQKRLDRYTEPPRSVDGPTTAKHSEPLTPTAMPGPTPRPAEVTRRLPRPRAVPIEKPRAPEPEPSGPVVRIGVDYGTTTTQVAVRVGRGEPILLPLEPGREFIPSYVARRPDGSLAFGSEAQNLDVSVHSLKPLLDNDQPIKALGGMRASDAVRAFLAEVVARTLTQLRNQRLIGPTVERLEIATRFGTTPRFGLETRTRIRDIAQAAGFNVRLTELLEEPVAAAFELVYGGTAPDGTLMVVDVGGGTLDVAVIRSNLGASKFELFATRGSHYAGDEFTKVISDYLEGEVRQRAKRRKALDDRSSTLLWARAEQAKLQLSSRTTATVPLGGIAGIVDQDLTLTREWYERASGQLVVRFIHEIYSAYRQARLILDRGGPDDPAPGTLTFREAPNGALTKLTEVDPGADARAHLKAIIPVGGGSHSPVVRSALENAFGRTLVQDPQIDPVGAIALGLARGDAMETVNLRYPNWGISAVFDGADREYPLYEPYASTLAIRGGSTSMYGYELTLPHEPRGVRLVFRPIGGAAAETWPTLEVPSGTKSLRLGLNLFGHVTLQATGSFAGSIDLKANHPGLRAPWMPPEGGDIGAWVPPSARRDAYKDVNEWRWDGGG